MYLILFLYLKNSVPNSLSFCADNTFVSFILALWYLLQASISAFLFL
jgi:hypothetical protein